MCGEWLKYFAQTTLIPYRNRYSFMTQNLFDRPDYKGQLRAHTRDELKALLAFVRHYWFLSGLMIAGLVLLVVQSNPFPPRTVTIATGQPHSSADILGQWYRDFFAANGVDLVLIPSNGAENNLKILEAGGAQAAFTQAGIPAPSGSKLLSLGSIEFQPMWLFYRGEAVDQNWAKQLMSQWKIAVGLENSGTYFMVRDLLKEYGLKPEQYDNLLKIPTGESIEKLINGEIDALFILSGSESENLQRLLNTENLNIWNFKAAKATASRIPYVDAVTFPRGAVSLSPMVPEQDVGLIATSATITVLDSLHPAIQYLFMMATESHYKNSENYFDRPGGFPAFLDQNVKKSPVAIKYIDNQGSVLQHDLPFWLASLFDRAWLMIAALLAIIIPLLKLIPQYRKYHFQLIQNSHYAAMNEIFLGIRVAGSVSELSALEIRFQDLVSRIEMTWAPAGTKEKYFFGLNALETIRNHIERKRKSLTESETAGLNQR